MFSEAVKERKGSANALTCGVAAGYSSLGYLGRIERHKHAHTHTQRHKILSRQTKRNKNHSSWYASNDKFEFSPRQVEAASMCVKQMNKQGCKAAVSVASARDSQRDTHTHTAPGALPLAATRRLERGKAGRGGVTWRSDHQQLNGMREPYSQPATAAIS